MGTFTPEEKVERSIYPECSVYNRIKREHPDVAQTLKKKAIARINNAYIDEIISLAKRDELTFDIERW